MMYVYRVYGECLWFLEMLICRNFHLQSKRPGIGEQLGSFTEHPLLREDEGIRSLTVGRVGEGGKRGRWRPPVVGSLSSCPSSSGSSRQRLLVEQTNDMSSWEVISKHSSTSTRFSIKTVCDVIVT